MTHGKLSLLTIIFLFVFILSGCTATNSQILDSDSTTVSSNVEVAQKTVRSSEIRPTIISQQTTSSSQNKLSDSAKVPTDWNGIERWLSNARESQTPINDVHQQLVAAGWQQPGGGVFAADLTGDGITEWVLQLQTPQQDPGLWGPTGNLWVMDGGFIVYRFHDAFDENDRQLTVPIVKAVGDVTGDGVAELFVDHPLCGAHTCSMQLRVLHGGTGTLENIVWRGPGLSDQEQTIQISDATLMLDAAKNLKITGGGVRSLGAGVPRLYTEVWSFSAESRQLTLDSTELEPSNMRHHLLYEANTLSALGEFGTAIELYKSAIHDETLENAESLSDGSQTIYEDTRQFAAFRLVWLGIQNFDSALVTEYRDWLLTNSTNLALTRAAQAMINAPNSTVACASAQRVLKEVEHPAGAVTYMGYANPTLTHDAFCP